MRIKVFTLFPEMLRTALETSILGRAAASGLAVFDLIDIRAYAKNKQKSVDDYPFGGGAGMVMTAQPIVTAIRAHTREAANRRRIYLSPRGRTLKQQIAEELSGYEELALLCGHYEGVDQRAIDLVIDEEISVGDYVLTGGEPAALVLIDAVVRLIPGVLGSDSSRREESFSDGLLEYPQYTRPREFEGMNVPDVLLNGHHAEIDKWRRDQAFQITRERRPELLAKATGE